MVYNAFPHFENPMVLLAALTEQLKCGGRLSIAHGMSREQLKQHHTGSARAVSVDLPTAEILAEMMEKFHLSVDVVISDERMYQVSGRK